MSTKEQISVMSIGEAASYLDVTPIRVRQLIHSGKLVTRNFSERVRLVMTDSIEAYKKSDRRPGPKAAR